MKACSISSSALPSLLGSALNITSTPSVHLTNHHLQHQYPLQSLSQPLSQPFLPSSDPPQKIPPRNHIPTAPSSSPTFAQLSSFSSSYSPPFFQSETLPPSPPSLSTPSTASSPSSTLSPKAPFSCSNSSSRSPSSAPTSASSIAD